MAHIALPGPQKRDEEISFRRIWDALHRDLWLVVGIVALALGIAALVTALQTPAYTSQATIRISDEQPSGLGALGDRLPISLGPLTGLGSGGIQTDIGVLRSRSLAEAVVDSLGLHVQPLEPEGRDVLRVLEAPRDAGPAVYLLERKGGDYVLRPKVGEDRSIKRVKISQPFQVGRVTLALSPTLQYNPPEQIEIAVLPFRTVVEELRKDLRIMQPNSGAQLVEIHYKSPNPRLAAAVPNAYARSFIAYQANTNQAESATSIDFLRDQIASYGADLEAAEQKLQAFRERAQVINPQEQASGQVRQYIDVQARRESLEAERASLERLFAGLEEGSGQQDPMVPSPYLQLASYPTFISNGAVQSMLQMLTQLENQRSELLLRRTPENFEVQEKTQRIADLELQLYQMASSYLQGVENQIASLDAALARFEDRLGTIPSREVTFARLSREQELLEQVYTLLQTRLKEEEVKAAAAPIDVRVIDPALVPLGPASPRPVLNLSLAAVLGLVLGLGLVFVREIRDRKIRSPEDITNATWGMPVLGMVPPGRLGNGDERGKLRLRRGPAIPGERLVALDPRNPASEAYRTVRTHLILADPEHSPQILVVTSAMSGEGRSTIAANLAVTLAQQLPRVLLVDADLRAGELFQLLPGARSEPGFAEVVLGQVSLDEVVQRIPVGTNGASGTVLHFIPSGTPPHNPTEVLGSERTREVLAELRDRYGAVVLDAPPFNLSSDAAVLGRAADAVILAARIGITDRKALEHATAQLHQLRIPVSGVVLNDSRAPAAFNG